jgi:hypothetical protein
MSLQRKFGFCRLFLGRIESQHPLATRTFELPQTLESKWVAADYSAKRQILETVLLTLRLGGTRHQLNFLCVSALITTIWSKSRCLRTRPSEHISAIRASHSPPLRRLVRNRSIRSYIRPTSTPASSNFLRSVRVSQRISHSLRAQWFSGRRVELQVT